MAKCAELIEAARAVCEFVEANGNVKVSPERFLQMYGDLRRALDKAAAQEPTCDVCGKSASVTVGNADYSESHWCTNCWNERRRNQGVA